MRQLFVPTRFGTSPIASSSPLDTRLAMKVAMPQLSFSATIAFTLFHHSIKTPDRNVGLVPNCTCEDTGVKPLGACARSQRTRTGSWCHRWDALMIDKWVADNV